MPLSLLANYTVNLTILPVYILPSAVVIVLQKTENRIGTEIINKNNNRSRRQKRIDHYWYCLIVTAASLA